MCLLASVVLAATLTIDIPANDVPRVSEAFGSIYNLGHNADMNEVSLATRQWIINQTKDYERRKNMTAYTPPPLEMQPSPTPTTTPGLAAAAAKVVSPTPTPKKK
jgi:hypothetical protein